MGFFLLLFERMTWNCALAKYIDFWQSYWMSKRKLNKKEMKNKTKNIIRILKAHKNIGKLFLLNVFLARTTQDAIHARTHRIQFFSHNKWLKNAISYLSTNHKNWMINCIKRVTSSCDAMWIAEIFQSFSPLNGFAMENK